VLLARTAEVQQSQNDFKRLSRLLMDPILAAARSKVWVFSRSLAGIAHSNPAGDMDVCLLRVLCVVRQKFLRRADHLSRAVVPSVCVCAIAEPQQKV